MSDDYPNDLARQNYYDEILGPGLEPSQINDSKYWVGVNKAQVVRHKDYGSIARGRAYPWEPDIDYDPRIDEDQADNFREEL